MVRVLQGTDGQNENTADQNQLKIGSETISICYCLPARIVGFAQVDEETNSFNKKRRLAASQVRELATALRAESITLHLSAKTNEQSATLVFGLPDP